MSERKRIYLCLAHMSEDGMEQKYVKEAFDTNWVVPLGPNVNGFEKDLEDFVNSLSPDPSPKGKGESMSKRVVALSSGTAAVHLGLLAAGVKAGDEVIVQSFTFCASTHPVTYLGATPVLVDSEINRFDIHCYGRDLSYERVVFFDRYNSHSSVYGTIVYNNCTFTNFVPSQFGGSYNAFVAHNVEFNDCIFNLTPNKNYLCRPLGVTKEINIRPELTKKCLPNIGIKNMTINMTEGVEDFTLFSFNNSPLKIQYLA